MKFIFWNIDNSLMISYSLYATQTKSIWILIIKCVYCIQHSTQTNGHSIQRIANVVCGKNIFAGSDNKHIWNINAYKIQSEIVLFCAGENECIQRNKNNPKNCKTDDERESSVQTVTMYLRSNNIPKRNSQGHVTLYANKMILSSM